LVRLTSHYTELEHRGSEILIGDLRCDRDIAKACQGARYIISAHGSNELSTEAIEAIDYRANIELIDQAKANSIQHFILISVLGAERVYEDAPVFKAKWAVENYLRASGLNHTILRPSGFASNLLPLAERFRQTGIYLLVGDPQHRTSIVSTDDLAQITVNSAFVEAARNQTFAVGGPNVLKREDLPKIFGNIFNREPIVLNPPLLALDGLRGVLGLWNPSLQKALGTLRALLANEYYCTSLEIDRLQSVFGLKLESLETFLRRYLGV
jgi:uncharacterized protein YbjT (DUF2867 family)